MAASQSVVDERERRLERERARRSSETAEQRQERLRKRRMRDRATQTVEQRDSALQQICINLCDQETAQQREAILHRMSERQSERLAVESADGRESRLQRTVHMLNIFNNDVIHTQ